MLFLARLIFSVLVNTASLTLIAQCHERLSRKGLPGTYVPENKYFFYIVTLRDTINNIRGLRLSKPRPMRTNKINLQIIYNGKEPKTNHTALSFYYNKER